jgi:hypothetical protein
MSDSKPRPNNWLRAHFETLTLDEAHEGYFLGRGAKEESIVRLGVKTWQPMSEDSPDEDFRERYGDRGERLGDWVLWPLYSPRGRVIGCAGRKGTEKRIIRHLLPIAGWQPIWTGLTPDVMERIWQGANIWVVEGIFDLLPLEWAIPATDVVLGSERAKLTDKHVEFLRRYCRGWVHMVYDNDEAGRHGVHDWVDEKGKTRWGALHRLSRVEVQATSISYRGKDPGEIWNHGGVAAMKAAFS